MEDINKWDFGYLRNYLEEEHETDPDFSNRASDIFDAVEELKEERASILDQWNTYRQITIKVISNLKAQVNNLDHNSAESDVDLFSKYKQIISDLKDKIMKLEVDVEDRDRDKAYYTESFNYNKVLIKKLEKEVEDLKKDNEYKDTDLTECAKIINLKDDEIRKLKDKLAKAEHELGQPSKLAVDGSDDDRYSEIDLRGYTCVETSDGKVTLVADSEEIVETDEDMLKKLDNFLNSKLQNKVEGE